MNGRTTLLLLLASAGCGSPAEAPKAAPSPQPPASAPREAEGLYALTARSLEGEEVDLAAFEGKVTLVVNLASACGFTPQYAGLQALQEELSGRDFSVLGFPSNDFGAQEPGDAAEIRAFCTTRYGVSFPLFAKVQTLPGAGQSPVYARLASLADGALPSWNFGKYLVSKDGTAVRYFPSQVAPDSPELRAAIDALLD